MTAQGIQFIMAYKEPRHFIERAYQSALKAVEHCPNKIDIKIHCDFKRDDLDDLPCIQIKGFEKGLTVSLNDTIEWSIRKGYKYYYRLDSDDINTQYRFKSTLEAFQKYPTTTFVYGRAYDLQTTHVLKSSICHEWLLRLVLSASNPIIHSTVAINLDNIVSRPYNEEFKFSQDYELWRKMSKTVDFRFFFLDEILVGVEKWHSCISITKKNEQLNCKSNLTSKHAYLINKKLLVNAYWLLSILITKFRWTRANYNRKV